MELEEKIGYRFKNIGYLNIALTRRSYCIEKRTKEYNQRLEFLGDSVLGLAIAEEIYKRFPNVKEGELTRLKAAVVCEKSLAIVANELELYKYLHIGRGELHLGIERLDSTTSDTMEAVFGAVFLDSNYETAKKIVLKIMNKRITESLLSLSETDTKSALQELVQRKYKLDLEYAIISEDGPEHNKHFVASVTHLGRVLGVGEGRTKKAAEKEAAKNAIRDYGYLYQ